MVGPMELLEQVAPTPTQAGGDNSRAATLALRFIAALEEIAACSLSGLAGRINAEGRGSASATKRYNGRKAAPVVRRIARSLVVGGLGSLRMEEMVYLSLHVDPEGAITGTVAKDGHMMRAFVSAEGVKGLLSCAREHIEGCCAGKEEGIVFDPRLVRALQGQGGRM